jgi:hypothetical protein
MRPLKDRLTRLEANLRTLKSTQPNNSLAGRKMTVFRHSIQWLWNGKGKLGYVCGHQ